MNSKQPEREHLWNTRNNGIKNFATIRTKDNRWIFHGITSKTCGRIKKTRANVFNGCDWKRTIYEKEREKQTKTLFTCDDEAIPPWACPFHFLHQPRSQNVLKIWTKELRVQLQLLGQFNLKHQERMYLEREQERKRRGRENMKEHLEGFLLEREWRTVPHPNEVEMPCSSKMC